MLCTKEKFSGIALLQDGEYGMGVFLLKLVSAIFIKFLFFNQIIALQKL